MKSPDVDDAGLPAGGDPPAEVSSRAAIRRALIEQSAAALGQIWAVGCREELRREGRAVAGGWPGTLREARSRVGYALQQEMQRRKMAAMSEEEREIAARTAYASARVEWLKQSEPDED